MVLTKQLFGKMIIKSSFAWESISERESKFEEGFNTKVKQFISKAIEFKKYLKAGIYYSRYT